MKLFINKLKNITLEEVNRNLLLLALCLLLFRIGNFYNTFIPKPFEAVLVLVILLTFADLMISKKFKEFFLSIHRKIWIALFGLVSSVFIGWAVAIFVKKIPVNLNVILEFGNFIISVIIFVLVLFYTRSDKVYFKRCLYALLLPVIYIVFLVFPEWAYSFYAGNNGTFLGFTMNPNIISKILLIPALFFMAHSLFKSRNRWTRVGYIIIASFSVALLFWTASRGGMLSLAISLVFLWLIFSLYNFSWKKLFLSGILILIIFLIGFAVTPQGGKQRVFLRVLYPAGSDASKYLPVIDQSKSASDVLAAFANDDSTKPIFLYPAGEDRLKIWPIYTKYVLMNPLGIGPNTHFSFDIKGNNGEYINSGPHNTFLQIWLWGGLLSILSFLYIFASAFKNLIDKLKSNFNPMALSLTTILFGLSISIMFDDSLSFFWFFIILALALRYENARS